MATEVRVTADAGAGPAPSHPNTPDAATSTSATAHRVSNFTHARRVFARSMCNWKIGLSVGVICASTVAAGLVPPAIAALAFAVTMLVFSLLVGLVGWIRGPSSTRVPPPAVVPPLRDGAVPDGVPPPAHVPAAGAAPGRAPAPAAPERPILQFSNFTEATREFWGSVFSWKMGLGIAVICSYTVATGFVSPAVAVLAFAVTTLAHSIFFFFVKWAEVSSRSFIDYFSFVATQIVGQVNTDLDARIGQVNTVIDQAVGSVGRLVEELPGQVGTGMIMSPWRAVCGAFGGGKKPAPLGGGAATSAAAEAPPASSDSSDKVSWREWFVEGFLPVPDGDS